MTIHKEKIETKIRDGYKGIEKLLDEYITPDLVRALRVLAKCYNGGGDSPEVSDFIGWVATYLTSEERKELGKEFPVMLDKGRTLVTGFPGLDNLLSRLGNVNVIPVVVGHSDGMIVYEGREGVKMEMERIDMLDVFDTTTLMGEQSAFSFSKDKKFYMFAQYKCDGCDEFHHKLYVVDEDNSSKSKDIIKSLQTKYKHMLISS